MTEAQVLTSLLRCKRVTPQQITDWASEVIREEENPPDWILDIAAFSLAHGRKALTGLLEASTDANDEDDTGTNAWRIALVGTYAAIYQRLREGRWEPLIVELGSELQKGKQFEPPDDDLFGRLIRACYIAYEWPNYDECKYGNDPNALFEQAMKEAAPIQAPPAILKIVLG